MCFWVLHRTFFLDFYSGKYISWKYFFDFLSAYMYLVGQVDGGGEAILCMNFETLDLDIPGSVSDQDVGLNFLYLRVEYTAHVIVKQQVKVWLESVRPILFTAMLFLTCSALETRRLSQPEGLRFWLLQFWLNCFDNVVKLIYLLDVQYYIFTII